jgi:hypothetical protein
MRLAGELPVQGDSKVDQFFFSYFLSVDEKFQGWVCVRKGEDGVETFICVDLEAVCSLYHLVVLFRAPDREILIASVFVPLMMKAASSAYFLHSTSGSPSTISIASFDDTL